MARADRRYTRGLMERLNRTLPLPDGWMWELQEGSKTNGIGWRVHECHNHAQYTQVAFGTTEGELQDSLGAFLDGVDIGNGARKLHSASPEPDNQ